MKNSIKIISYFLLIYSSHQVLASKLTPMDEVLQAQDIGCSTQLRQLEETTLKTNPYRILAHDENKPDIHLFNALAISSFRDRDSHVTFHGVKNTDGSCDTSVVQTYVLDTPCNDARNEAFSKWQYQGQLNAKTMVLKSKRETEKQAFLTDQFSNICLVTTRQVVRNKMF